MNKGGGMGGGSASIILIFAVLCLTVFTLIAFVVSGNEKALVDSEVMLVTDYYGADAKAEQILSEILKSDIRPETVDGIIIDYWYDFNSSVDMASFSCPLKNEKELFVSFAFVADADTYQIHSWNLRNIGDWEFDDSINLWTGDDTEFGFLFDEDAPGVWLTDEND